MPNSYEGVRINFPRYDGDGWLLIRQSVHDPVMPVNFASLLQGGDKVMAKYLYSFVSKYPFLDVSALKEFIEK